MKEAIAFVCIVLCVSWGGTLFAQTASSTSGGRPISTSPPSSAPANADQSASSLSPSQTEVGKHWYADPAMLSLFVAAFYTFLTLIIVLYMRQQTLLQNFDMMAQQLEDTRTDRAVLRAYVTEGDVRIPPPPGPVLEAADRVCRIFDLLGFMDRRHLLNRNLVDEFYSVPFVLLYEQLLGGYAAYLRDESRRGSTHFWELVQFYERVRYVPQNHPGRTTGATKWPAHPRRAPKAAISGAN